MPASACRITLRASGVRSAGNDGRIEFVGFADPVGEDAVEVGAERLAALLGGARAAGAPSASRRARRQDVPCRGFRSGALPDLRRPRTPCTTYSLMPSFTYGVGFGDPNRRW